jgi:16S rRNA processing protein RimM
MQKQYLEAGRIIGTHGVHGELRIEPWCDSAEFLKKFHTLYLDAKGDVPVTVLSSHVQKNQLIAALDGVDTVEKADVYRGKVLYLNRADVKIPKGIYFVDDLIGLSVYDADTFVYYGTLTDVMQTGANDVYQITSIDKKNYLIPAVAPVVSRIDFEKEKMFIRPIKGIFDDEN